MSVGIRDSEFGIGESCHCATVRFPCARVNKQTIGGAFNSRVDGFDESPIPNPESRGYTP